MTRLRGAEHGIEPDDLEDITRCCLHCCATLIRTVRPLSATPTIALNSHYRLSHLHHHPHHVHPARGRHPIHVPSNLRNLCDRNSVAATGRQNRSYEMQSLVIISAAVLITGSSLAQAPSSQSPPAQNQPAQSQTQSNHAAGSGGQAQTQSIRQQVQRNLQQSGYTDIKIMPESIPDSRKGQGWQPGDDGHQSGFCHGNHRDQPRERKPNHRQRQRRVSARNTDRTDRLQKQVIDQTQLRASQPKAEMGPCAAAVSL